MSMPLVILVVMKRYLCYYLFYGTKRQYVKLCFVGEKQMELIKNLEERRVQGKSVRQLLSKYGLSDVGQVTTPFIKMSEEATIKAVLKWIVLNSKNGQSYKIRLRIVERQTVYEIHLTRYQTMIRVNKVMEKPELMSKILHHWIGDENYQTLQFDDITKSVKRANFVNRNGKDVVTAINAQDHQNENPMELVEYLKKHRKNQKDIRPLLQTLGSVHEAENQQPLYKLAHNKVITMILNWFAWKAKGKQYIKLRICENDGKIYEIGLTLKKRKIRVRNICENTELRRKMLYHWYCTVTYQNLSVKEIKNSIKNADTLNLIDTECSSIENACDLDVDIM